MLLLAACLLLDAQAPSWFPNNLIARFKYYVLQLGDPTPTHTCKRDTRKGPVTPAPIVSASSQPFQRDMRSAMRSGGSVRLRAPTPVGALPPSDRPPGPGQGPGAGTHRLRADARGGGWSGPRGRHLIARVQLRGLFVAGGHPPRSVDVATRLTSAPIGTQAGAWGGTPSRRGAGLRVCAGLGVRANRKYRASERPPLGASAGA